MGFFSWVTQDTNRSIANQYSNRVPFTVYMHDNKGNVYEEDNYEGYGVFGGKDYYVLLAEMNGFKSSDEEKARYYGLGLAFGDAASDIFYPNLVEDKDWQWIDQEPEHCEFQGFFY